MQVVSPQDYSTSNVLQYMFIIYINLKQMLRDSRKEKINLSQSVYDSPKKMNHSYIHDLQTDYKDRSKESNIIHSEPSKEQNETPEKIEKELDNLEKDVRTIESRLREIYYESLGLYTDQTQKKKILEDQRLELKKNLIDINQHHQHLINKKINLEKNIILNHEESHVNQKQDYNQLMEAELARSRRLQLQYELLRYRPLRYYDYPLPYDYVLW